MAVGMLNPTSPEDGLHRARRLLEERVKYYDDRLLNHKLERDGYLEAYATRRELLDLLARIDKITRLKERDL